MIATHIATPGNREWGTLYLDEPRVLRFYGSQPGNDRAKWKWVTVKELMRSLIEFHYASKQRMYIDRSDPNLTFGELINNFRPLFVLEHLPLWQYEEKMNVATPFLRAKMDPDNERLLLCGQISPVSVIEYNQEQALVPYGFSKRVRELIIGLGMFIIDDEPPPGLVLHKDPGQPPALWAHSLADTDHVQLALSRGPNPRWTWGDVLRTPLGAKRTPADKPQGPAEQKVQ